MSCDGFKLAESGFVGYWTIKLVGLFITRLANIELDDLYT